MRRSRLPLGWRVYESEWRPRAGVVWGAGWYFAPLAGCYPRAGAGGSLTHYTSDEAPTRNAAVARLLQHLREIGRWPPPPPHRKLLDENPPDEAELGRRRFRRLFPGRW